VNPPLAEAGRSSCRCSSLINVVQSSSSPAALQERFDRELQRQTIAHGNQSATTGTDESADTNGVSDVAAGMEEAAPLEGINQRQGQTETRLQQTEEQLH
ncbi:hypothetical protein ILYODFUR_037470, partial [Ilyodon furcidens]